MAEVLLTDADDGHTIEVRPGDVIVIRLAENPTTGYRWHVERADAPVESAGDRNLVPATAFPGSPAPREFRFAARLPGSGDLAFKLWQQWEGEPSVDRRFVVHVVVAA
jgi:inhibitor of cysteine peptidase